MTPRRTVFETDYEKFKRKHPILLWKAGVMLNFENWWYGVRQRFWIITSALCFILRWDWLAMKCHKRVNR